MTEYICNLAKGVCPHCCRLITDRPNDANMDCIIGPMGTDFTAKRIVCYRSILFLDSPYWMPEEDWKRCKEEKQ